MSEPSPDTSMTNVEREQHIQAAQKKAADAAEADAIKDSDFRAILRDGHELLRISEEEFADELRVSHTRINRWLHGKDLPHPVMRPGIAAWVAHKLSESARNK
jgi:ribosome-binding protein aMBF1 (putative translation factor)